VSETGFPYKCRLLNAVDYKSVFDTAQYKVSCQSFLILASTNSTTYPRLGLIIAKKNVARAVQRNRVKRLIRESFRHNKALIGGLDIVFLARKDAGNLSNGRISERVQVLLAELSKRACPD
jgi:ribonuclease P protein component|tara:strand:- start:2239 stop:2601 length:363 start_codon:yes stop_codon:yes gene_type:complete